MRAVQYRAVGGSPEVVDVPEPEPGPGEILLRVSAAGVCHSDFAVMSMPADALRFPLPLTLGHEGAGTVAALGAGVTGVAEGEPVAVYGPWGCGRCHACSEGRENVCSRAAELGILPPGLGSPGAMAEYVLVDDARHLVSLGELDPVVAAPLTDAGLTPYHAIKRSLPKLVPGTTAVVIGIGGLGHLAVQMLRVLSPARVVAMDIADDKLELARTVGAHETVHSAPGAAGTVRELTGGRGAEAVFDFTGIQPTVSLAVACAGVDADVVIVGIGGGVASVGFGTTPYDTSVRSPYWGSRSELLEVLDLARAGQISVSTEPFGIEDAPVAYERFAAGGISGRAVIVL